MARTDRVTDDERREIWDNWLEGCSLAFIRDYKVDGHSAAVLKSVLEEEPPESIRNDDRYRYGGQFFWIYARGLTSPVTGEDLAFVMAKRPRKISNAAFGKALTAIRRDFGGEHPEAALNIHVIEGIEAEVALRYVNERGCPGWTIDAEGGIERMVPAPAAEPDESPAPRA